VVQRVIDRTGLWLALMLVKVGLQLLFSFLGVNEKLLSRLEG
jgi:hypothetical protein